MGCCNSKADTVPKRINREDSTLSCYELTSPISSGAGVHKGDFVQIQLIPIKQRYETKGILGEGAFGTVFEVRDRKTEARKAMKELPKTKMTDEEIQEVIHEIGVLRELDHPHIMGIYEVVESETSIYIVSEFLSGGELFDKIASMSGLTESLAAVYTRDILKALSYLHDHGVVHRDLKPENIMLSSKAEDAEVKIIDFGISARIVPDENLTQTIGTVFYMAPETFEGNYDEKCDIWSLGVILYVMLSGEFPFKADTDREAVKEIKEGKYSFTSSVWSKITDQAKDLISKMMNTDPIERLSAKEALNHPWIFKNVYSEFEVNSVSIEAFDNLKRFHANNRVEKSILTFISSQMLQTRNTQNLAEIFKSLDVNHDGKLSKEELIEGFSKLGLNESIDIETLMETCDMDNSGYLDYSEFLLATNDWQSNCSKDLLKKTFSIYDDTGNGQLSIEKLRRHLPGIEDSDWNQFLIDADTDGDGQISLSELREYLSTQI